MQSSKLVLLEEQGLRDGLQTLTQIISTEQKIAYIHRFLAAGIKRIQVASFVHPKLVPQMADAAALIAQLPKVEGVVFSALVLNAKGVERAADTGIQHLAISMSASDLHSQKNAHMTFEEAKIEFQKMVQLAHRQGIVVRGGIQCAFGCRYEGRVAAQKVLDLVKHHLDSGVEELALADSTGMANPLQVKNMMEKILQTTDNVPVALHLHNTENKGLANVFAALEAGIRQFDTAFGGLGGCPFIQSASGNIATEDTAHLLHQMDFQTNIDIEKVATISLDFQYLIQQELQGQMYKLYQNKAIKIV